MTLSTAADLEDILPQPIEHPAIAYFDAPLHDPISELIDRIEKGKAKLDYDSARWSYLPNLLRQLDINPDSQILVFSQTSFHPDLVSQTTPRAIYFNDTVSVAFVQHNDVLEISSLDPKQGIIFYTLSTRKTAQPDFGLGGLECLACHRGAQTLGVPGRLISSVYGIGPATRTRFIVCPSSPISASLFQNAGEDGTSAASWDLRSIAERCWVSIRRHRSRTRKRPKKTPSYRKI